MDMGIKGRTALVCAASKGLGKGCAMALAGEGVNLVITARGAGVGDGRRSAGRAACRDRRRATSRRRTDARRQAAAPQFDILVNNAAARRRATSASTRTRTGRKR
jgi:3-oxoacyl-[acyl-carrier protein] reductase